MERCIGQMVWQRVNFLKLRAEHERYCQQRTIVKSGALIEEDLLFERLGDVAQIVQKTVLVNNQRIVVQISKTKKQSWKINQKD